MESEIKFVKTYRRAFSVLSFINNLVPNLIQRPVVKVFEKDKYILESYK